MAKKIHNHASQREERRRMLKEIGTRFNKKNNAKADPAFIKQRPEAEQKAPAKKIEVKFSEKKTRAKAAGVKSVFALKNQSVLVTSFGKGNTPISEKEIVSGSVKDLQEKAAFSLLVDDGGNKYTVKGRAGICAKPDAPAFDSANRIGQDLINCKDELETRYFGRTFGDSIHIQLIYSILDIEKMLAVHANNVIYAINNLRRRESQDFSDFIGYMSTVNDYATFCNPETHFTDKQKGIIENIKSARAIFDEMAKNPRLFYFGEAFTDKKEKNGLKPKEDIYWIFALLGGLRQFCAHDKTKARHWLYCLDDPEMLPKNGKNYLKANYLSAVQKLDKGFVKNNASANFTLLFKAFNAASNAEKIKIALEYYDFIVRKVYKNMGFSLKVLREFMLTDKDFAVYGDDKYSTVRNKLYQIFDFALYKHYTEDPEAANRLIEKLRASLSEEEKASVYAKEAAAIAPAIKAVLKSVTPHLDKIKANKVKELALDGDTKALIENAISKRQIKNQQVSTFTEFIYLVTQVIDGKEINDLLTTLIHQFENIAGFIKTMKENNIPCEFEGNYKFFETSAAVAEEIRLVNSFARMTKIEADAKGVMFDEAALVLGTDWDHERIVSELKLDVKGKKGKNSEHGFRNFIINNVIKSRKFHYLVRYANISNVRKLADNASLVKLVLGTLPETQIARYAQTCGAMSGNPIDALTKEITGLKFDDFKNVNQSANAETNTDKAVKQAKIGLYLTVLYLLTKNLVNVNSRYFMAFHCLERDSQLKGGKYSSGANHKNYCNMASLYAEEKMQKAQVRFDASKKQYSDKKRYYEVVRTHDYIIADIGNSDDYARALFRNNVAHLNVVRNAADLIENGKFKSYYQLYHYLMQKDIAARYKSQIGAIVPNKSTIGYLDELDKYNGISKDFIKALCAPFAYNLPRFKNLSVETLFDKNNKPETDAKKG